MSKLQSIINVGLVVIGSLSVVNSVNAQQPYIGVSVMTPGEGQLTYAPGKSVADYDHFLAKKIYGGLTFDHDLSIEAGALSWGYQFLVPTKGNPSGVKQQLKVNMQYLAGKASMSLSENVNLFAKLGIAHTHSNFSGFGSETNVRGLTAFGVDYRMSKNIDLVIEFHRAGSIKGVPQEKLEAGVKWRF